jgi:hypothetical protein
MIEYGQHGLVRYRTDTGEAWSLNNFGRWEPVKEYKE